MLTITIKSSNHNRTPTLSGMDVESGGGGTGDVSLPTYESLDRSIENEEPDVHGTLTIFRFNDKQSRVTWER